MLNRFLPGLLLCSLLASCGGGGSAPVSATPPLTPTPQALTVSGDTGKVLLGRAPVTLSATPAAPATLSWSLDEGPGTLSATTGNGVSYTPPANGNNPHVTISVKRATLASHSASGLIRNRPRLG